MEKEKADGAKEPVKHGEVLFAVSFYMVTSITMVMVNKWVLKDIPYPLTFLWLQVAVAVAILYGADIFGFLKAPKMSWETCRKLTGLIAVNVMGLSFNTLCIQYVDASFYQVARSLILPFTVALSSIVLSKKTSFRVMMCCLVVCCGFLTGLGGEIHLSYAGVFFGIVSSFTTAIHAVIIKGSLEVVENNTWDLVFYNNFLTFFALFPIVLCTGEISPFIDEIIYDQGGNQMRFFVGTFIAGVFGFLINLAGFLQIKVTSPVTHMISSAVRGVLQTIIAVWLFSDPLSPLKLIGIALILIVSSFYAYFKTKESGGH